MGLVLMPNYSFIAARCEMDHYVLCYSSNVRVAGNIRHMLYLYVTIFISCNRAKFLWNQNDKPSTYLSCIRFQFLFGSIYVGWISSRSYY